ncbi:MAG: universal stress protein [Chromatiales bacterium]|nr:universal stress protein [Chromatiales bacterium]
MMAGYKHILVAADANGGSEHVVERAGWIQSQSQCSVTLLYVLEHFPEDLPAEMVPPEGESRFDWIREKAENSLTELAKQSGVIKPGIRVEQGSLRPQILEVARELKTDLILVGAHEHHWLALLWPSTADGVVHTAPCDVLSIHLPASDYS